MSKVEVNTVEPQCGTTLTVGKACGSVRTASNNIQASDGGNLISQCGTTITLGASGDTISLASGASQTGFGRTGTVDWITTPKVTGDSPVTGVSGKGYFMNTTGGAITLNLPAGSAGDIISLADYAGTWQTANVTVSPNGTEKIGGTNADAVLNTEGQSVTFVYTDSTQGWINTMDSTSNVRGSSFISATVSGACNTLTTIGDYKVAKFVNPGTFCVSQGAGPLASVDYLIVAGGGGGGSECTNAGGGGGGGAGGVRIGAVCSSPTHSPIVATGGIPLTVQPYAVVVGGGGPGGPTSVPGTGASGNTSSFACFTAAGGGGGGASASGTNGVNGGAGGGSGSTAGCGCQVGGTGNTPPVNPPQGKDGGASTPSLSFGGGGGGGATTAGSAKTAGPNEQTGGSGVSAAPIFGAAPQPFGYIADGPDNGVSVCGTFGGGGGAGNDPGPTRGNSLGGPGGGANKPGTAGCGVAGTQYTGGGGSGSGRDTPKGQGGAGGSGIVLIRYKFQ